MHILMMGVLSYLYHYQPNTLKEKKLLEYLWGSDWSYIFHYFVRLNQIVYVNENIISILNQPIYYNIYVNKK